MKIRAFTVALATVLFLGLAACQSETEGECEWAAQSVEYAATVAGSVRPAPAPRAPAPKAPSVKVPGAKPPAKMPTVKPPKPGTPPVGKVWVWVCD